MSLLANLDIEKPQSFWKIYPAYKIPKTYNEFYKSDKSKNKKISSTIMWAICLLYENVEENPYRRYTEDEKMEVIAEDFIEDSTFKWEDYQNIIDYYKKSNLSYTEKSIINLENKLKERDAFINDTEYTLDSYVENPKTGKVSLEKGTADQLDKMVVNSEKIYKLLSNLKQDLIKERESESNSTTKGDMKESAGDTGEI